MRGKKRFKVLVAILTTLVMVLTLTFSEETAQGNNLSFPVIAVDNLEITPYLGDPVFTTTFIFDANLLPQTEIDRLLAISANWYAQKIEGNIWQADFINNVGGPVIVSEVDWGDSLETVKHKVRSSVRLELTLYKDVVEPMKGYNMEVLANASSPDEVQGTDTTTYDALEATIVTDQGIFAVQYFGESIPELTWDINNKMWTFDKYNNINAPIIISFAPELNVGGKYIFGASEGAWKPQKAGWYRLTFYTPLESEIKFNDTETGIRIDPEKTYLYSAQIMGTHNLTYIDIEIISSRTSGGKKK